MATGSILLDIAAARVPDGTTDNISPAIQRIKGVQTGAAVFLLVAAFDGAGSVPENLYWSFVMPANYSSGGTLKVTGMIGSSTGNVAVMQAQVAAVTPADADTPLQRAFSTAATVNITANTTEVRRLLTGDITLNMDSAAAGDLVTIRLFRDPANGSDTHTTDFECTGCEFTYTTS